MQVHVQKWGNSLSLRIPKSFAKQTKISKGSLVDLSIKNDNLIIIPILEEKDNLGSFLSKIDESNIHSEIDFGAPVGKELL